MFYFFCPSLVNAADDKFKNGITETFISGDASVGAQLVDSCAACHGVDGNSISTDWPKLSRQNRDIFMNNLNTLEMVKNECFNDVSNSYLQTLPMRI